MKSFTHIVNSHTTATGQTQN